MRFQVDETREGTRGFLGDVRPNAGFIDIDDFFDLTDGVFLLLTILLSASCCDVGVGTSSMWTRGSKCSSSLTATFDWEWKFSLLTITVGVLLA